MRWVVRQFAEDCPLLMKLMVERGLASAESVPASGTAKTRVRLNTSWPELRNALRDPKAASSRVASFLEEARRVFGA